MNQLMRVGRFEAILRVCQTSIFGGSAEQGRRAVKIWRLMSLEPPHEPP